MVFWSRSTREWWSRRNADSFLGSFSKSWWFLMTRLKIITPSYNDSCEVVFCKYWSHQLWRDESEEVAKEELINEWCLVVEITWVVIRGGWSWSHVTHVWSHLSLQPQTHETGYHDVSDDGCSQIILQQTVNWYFHILSLHTLILFKFKLDIFQLITLDDSMMQCLRCD